MKIMTKARSLPFAAVLAGLALSACTSVEYRCPLDPNGKPTSSTACKGMDDAYQASKRGAGGSTSVFMDDKGRIVPREVLEGRAATPLSEAGKAANAGYFAPSGEPVFQQPKQFQVWSESFRDANGNLHDGHHVWFTTPGRWLRGTMDTPGAVGQNVLRPVQGSDRPQGRVVQADRNGNVAQGQTPSAAQQAKKDGDAAAMASLSQAANSSANAAGNKAAQKVAPRQAAAGVTAPSLNLND